MGSAGGLRQGETPSNYLRPVSPWVWAQLHMRQLHHSQDSVQMKIQGSLSKIIQNFKMATAEP